MSCWSCPSSSSPEGHPPRPAHVSVAGRSLFSHLFVLVLQTLQCRIQLHPLGHCRYKLTRTSLHWSDLPSPCDSIVRRCFRSSRAFLRPATSEKNELVQHESLGGPDVLELIYPRRHLLLVLLVFLVSLLHKLLDLHTHWLTLLASWLSRSYLLVLGLIQRLKIALNLVLLLRLHPPPLMHCNLTWKAANSSSRFTGFGGGLL